jgi:hypothetical protein
MILPFLTLVLCARGHSTMLPIRHPLAPTFRYLTSTPSLGILRLIYQVLNNNGSATINEGADGLQRLDKLVSTADKYGIKLILTLTNNWNPVKTEPSTAFSRRNDGGLPRGYLSNDYGQSSVPHNILGW